LLKIGSNDNLPEICNDTPLLQELDEEKLKTLIDRVCS
jgi:hypothetical protein